MSLVQRFHCASIGRVQIFIYMNQGPTSSSPLCTYVQTCVLCGEVAPGAFPPHGGVGKRSETAEYLVKVSANVFVFCKQTAALVNSQLLLPYLLQYPPCFSFSEYEFLITRRLATFRIYCRRKECEKAVYRIMWLYRQLFTHIHHSLNRRQMSGTCVYMYQSVRQVRNFF